MSALLARSLPSKEAPAVRFSPKLIALLAVLAAALALPTAASANARQFSIFEAPTELLGSSDQLRQKTLDEIQRTGARWLRVVLYWRNVAPAPTSHHVPVFDESNPAYYNWSAYDAAIGEARAKGFHILLTVTAPAPTWATYRGRDDSGTLRPSAKRFREFMTAVGRHYASDVDDWAIWNEPNHPDFLRPQFKHGHPVSGRLYRRLYRAGYRGIMATAANRRDKVLAGETAPVGTSHVVAPLAFMRQMLCLNKRYKRRGHCRKLPISGWAHHAYTRKQGPYYHDSHPDNVVIGDLGRLNRALGLAGRAGAIPRHVGIYLTEFGIQTKPDPFYGVGYRLGAEYRSISEWIAFHNPRVKAFSQYLMRDDAPLATRNKLQRWSGFQSGLRTWTGRRKGALYKSYPIPLVALETRHNRILLWGYLRPANGQRLGRQRVQVYFHNRHGRWHKLRRARTDRRGYWRLKTAYRKGRYFRVVWRDPDTGVRYRGPATRYHSMP